jgi:excisionase family DNA binding protein
VEEQTGRVIGMATGNDQADYRDLYYSTTEAAKVMGITESRVRQLARQGRLEGERTEAGWKLYRYSVHAFRDEKAAEEGPVEAREATAEAREWIERVTTLQRELGRLEGRLELTEKAESTLQSERARLLEDLQRERTRAEEMERRAEDIVAAREEAQREAQRLAAELAAERTKGFWRRLFGG